MINPCVLVFCQVHNESETILRDIETRLNNSYNTAVTSYHSIVKTYRNASSLYEEVKEAEGMILILYITVQKAVD